MPSSSEKLRERMRRTQSGWTRTDLDRLFEGFGFMIKAGGNHDKVSHPEFPQLVTSLPRHTRVHRYIVVQALKMLEQLEALKIQQEQGDSEETDE